MASDQVSSSVRAPLPPPPLQQFLQAWLLRLGLSGKLLAIGGLVGLIAVFLPLVTMTMSLQLPGGGNPFGGKGGVNIPAVSSSHSVLVIQDFRGILCLLGYVAALALAFVLYQPNGLREKALGWAGLGVGAFITLLALWMLLAALNGSGSLMGFQISVGFGAFFNLLASAAVATGGFLKAREEGLIQWGTVLSNPQRQTPAQETVLETTSASAEVATAQPPALAAAISQGPPPLSIALPPAAETRHGREDREVAPPLSIALPPAETRRGREDREAAPPAPGRSAQKPSDGFPVILALAVGGSVVVGVIGGLFMWKFGGADPQPANAAVVQKVQEKQDKDPAPEEKESNNGKDTPEKKDPDKKEPEAEPVILPKEKDSKPAADVPAGSQRRLNLMPILDLSIDLVEGKNKWRLQDQTLICDTGHFCPRVQIRYVPPEEYDFSVTFSQPKNLRNGVSLILPKPGGGTFFWTVGMRNGKGFGFGVQGKDRGGDAAKLIQIGTTYTTTVQVRRNGVKGLLDGQVLVNFPTDFRNLTNDSWHRMPNDTVLGVACDDPTTFHRIHLVEVTGSGKAIR
jgi:hypothetical protein